MRDCSNTLEAYLLRGACECEAEDGLAVVSVKRPPLHWGTDELAPIQHLVERLRREGDGVVVAIDGSSVDRREAGWGVALVGARHSGAVEFCGAVKGADQTSWAAEMSALEQVCAAASGAGIDVNVIDNKEVQTSFNALMQGRLKIPKAGFVGRCRSIAALCKGRSHKAYWVPSHDKLMNRWEPAVDHLRTSGEWRELNRIAELAAERGRRMARLHYKWKEFDQRWRKTAARSRGCCSECCLEQGSTSSRMKACARSADTLSKWRIRSGGVTGETSR